MPWAPADIVRSAGSRASPARIASVKVVKVLFRLLRSSGLAGDERVDAHGVVARTSFSCSERDPQHRRLQQAPRHRFPYGETLRARGGSPEAVPCGMR